MKHLIVAAMLACSCVQNVQPPTEPSPEVQYAKTSVTWETDVNLAAELAVRSHKLMLVVFVKTDCAPCEMTLASINSPIVRDLVNNELVALQVDSESELASNAGVDQFPTLVVVQATLTGGEPVKVHVGPLNEAQVFSFIQDAKRKLVK